MESIMKTRKSVYLSKLFRTSVLFGCFFSFGFSRSLAGPTMLELEKQVHGNANTFQIVFLLGAITFPLGNILAGFIMDKISPCLILFFATLILSFSNCSIPFSPNITVLATGTSFSEFALGLIDTGANVYCLQIWGESSGPYFSALHMSQGIGFLMAPILAERVLTTAIDSEMATLHIPMNKTIDQLLEVSAEVTTHPGMITPLQSLYLSIGFAALIVAVGFIFGIPADLKNTNVLDFPLDQIRALESKLMPSKSESWSTTLLISIMTFYSLCGYGLSFAFGSFLTAFSVFGPLGLTPQIGARITSFYYGAQVLMRALNVFLVGKFRRITLVWFYLILVTLGAFILFVIPGVHGLALGSIVVGLGSGSLFPMGLLWIQGEMEISSKVTGLFCLGTTLGAQFFRFPEGAFISSVPKVHLYLLITALASCVVSFFAANAIVSRRKADMRQANSRLSTISLNIPKHILAQAGQFTK